MVLLHDFLRSAARQYAGRVAMISGERRTSFEELERESDSLAAGLQAMGLERGDRCGIVLDNAPELVTSLFAVLKAGGVFTVLSPALKEAKLASILNDCGAKLLIAAGSAAKQVAAVVPRAASLRGVVWTQPPAAPTSGIPQERAMKDMVTHGGAPREAGTVESDVAAIIYTSGTTGEPKGAMLTHKNLVNTTSVVTGYLKNTAEDVVCCVLPMAFSYGLCQALGMACAGYTLLIEKSFAFPMDVLKRAAAARVTGLPGVPTMFAKLVQMAPIAGVDLSTLRYVTNAAAAIPPAHLRRFREAFPEVAFYAMYGQTECTRAAFLDPALVDSKPTSVGKAIANSELFLVDPSGRRLGLGQTGELVVRGANVMKGYWGRPQATAEKLRDWEGQKALFTGDDFRTDGQGLFYYVGRQDDIFKCKGEKVAPREVEQTIYELPEVAEVAVFGVEDPVDGLAVKALVVARDGAALTEIAVRRHCQASLEPFLVPKFIEFRTELPKTDSGKLKRSALAPSAQGGG